MSYTPTVPQATQTISSTQAPIQANFQFLNDAIGQEHHFDVTDATKTYHTQASMPNRADPGALPMDTHGMYYVSGGLPKFYNTSASFIQISSTPYKMLTGTVLLSTSNTNVVAIPANSVGNYWIWRKGSNGTVNVSSAAGMIISDNTDLFVAREQNFDPGISMSNSLLTLRAQTTSSSFNGTYTYLVVYYNP